MAWAQYNLIEKDGLPAGNINAVQTDEITESESLADWAAASKSQTPCPPDLNPDLYIVDTTQDPHVIVPKE